MAQQSRIEVFNLMKEQGLVPLFYQSDIDIAKKLLKAIYDGGGRLLEFTNRGDRAHVIFEELINYAIAELPGMTLGVGSVTDAGSASYYMSLGANFIVTPVLREDIAIVCNRRKVMWSPGCGTLTEICKAEELGCELVKVFPGSVYGPGFVKSVRAPQPWTNIMPTGGVAPTEENLKSWFGAGVTCVGMGSKLFVKDSDGNYDYAEISKIVKSSLALIETLK